MGFNSIRFLLFFGVVYAVYLSLRSHYKFQNYLLVIASLLFYLTWSLLLVKILLLSTFLSFSVANIMARVRKEAHRKTFLVTVLIIHLGVLFLFKQYSFFSKEFSDLMALVGIETNHLFIQGAIPVAGLSFYTFQLMGYFIDVFQEKMEPTKDLVSFFLYVCFFPQLIAGPIGRAEKLLPQYSRPRHIYASQINAAIFLILWGYFQKNFIADNLGRIPIAVFKNGLTAPSIDVFIANFAFMFQLYCDFAGYSNIARGLSKLFGIELDINFKLPYLSSHPTEFWNNWHISLSHWFRDYLYTPLAIVLSRWHSGLSYLSVFVTMVLIGLWHGATWSFILFGAYHGFLIIGHRLLAKHVRLSFLEGKEYEKASKIGVMFIFTYFGMVIFRTSSLSELNLVFSRMSLHFTDATMSYVAAFGLFTLPLMAIEYWQFKTKDMLVITKTPIPFRILFYAGLLIMVVSFGYRDHRDFLYFQF